MKRLYLLRHAQALPGETGEDKARKLSPNGVKDAEALGQMMAKRGYTPGAVLCSPATRTRETLQGLLLEAPADFPEILYNGSAGDLFHRIQQAGDTDSILVVAHVPGIYELAVQLAGDGHATLTNRLTEGYQPGALSVLDCPCENWAEIQPGANTLIDFIDPLDYNAPATPARWT